MAISAWFNYVDDFRIVFFNEIYKLMSSRISWCEVASKFHKKEIDEVNKVYVYYGYWIDSIEDCRKSLWCKQYFIRISTLILLMVDFLRIYVFGPFSFKIYMELFYVLCSKPITI